MLGQQAAQPVADLAVVDRVGNPVGIAGTGVRHPGVHVDDEGLRAMQFRVVDAYDGFADEALDKDQVEPPGLVGRGRRCGFAGQAWHGSADVQQGLRRRNCVEGSGLQITGHSGRRKERRRG
jgi:hypothetical protein